MFKKVFIMYVQLLRIRDYGRYSQSLLILKAAVSPDLECLRTLTQAKLSVYVYACSKQTVNYNFRPGIGQKEVFAGIVASSRHLCRVVWCV